MYIEGTIGGDLIQNNARRVVFMAQALTTQNQNVQLTKTFIVAFAGMLLAVPIVTLITASIVQAQFGSLAYAAAQAPQTNSIVAGPSCEAPAHDPAVADTQANTADQNLFTKATKWIPFGQSNYSSTSNNTTTNTTTNTSTVTIRDNGNTDNRLSGNSLDLSLTDNRWSGSTISTDLSDNSINTSIQDVGNTTVNDNSDNSVNTNIQNSGNTTNTDNSNNSVNDSGNTNVDVDVEVDAGLF